MSHASWADDRFVFRCIDLRIALVLMRPPMKQEVFCGCPWAHMTVWSLAFAGEGSGNPDLWLAKQALIVATNRVD